MGNIIGAIMPCMAKINGDDKGPGTVTLSITSTSSCCRGKIMRVELSNEQVAEISRLLSDLISKTK